MNRPLTFAGLTGKTLVFTLPLKTITFVLPPSGDDIFSFAEIKTQIEAQEPLLWVRQLRGKLAITRQTVTVGINLNFVGSTANSILGFSTTAITLGKVYGTPGGVAPRLLAANQIGSGHLQVITDE